MGKKNLIGACVVLSLLAACQQKESLQDVNNNPVVNLEASVCTLGNMARTVTDEAGSTVFSEGDELGFFMPGEMESVKWTLTGNKWKSESSLVWKDKVSSFMFCAYYPYVEEPVTRDNIPMPDLSKQQGTLTSLGDFDFLSARCQTSYKETDNGTISFTGEASFRHVYSLVSVTIKKDLPTENVLLSKATFQGDNMFSRSMYHFGESIEEDGFSFLESSLVNALTFQYEEPVSISDESGYTLFFLCNPSELVEDSEFSIAYQRDGIAHTASTKKLGKQFSAGKYYQFILRLTKEELKLEGSEISDWISEKLPEIGIDEIPS